MSFYPYDEEEAQVRETIQDIKIESSFIDNIFDALGSLFYTIFPGLKTKEIQDELTLMELREDEGYVSPVGTLNATEVKKAIEKAEKAEDEGGDLFETLSKELSDKEEVDKKLKALLDND